MSHNFNKRKRRSFDSITEPSSSQLPSSGQPINPHSHAPNTLYQFTLAGLAGDDEDPALYSPHFPHKALQEFGTNSKFEPIAADGFESDGDTHKRTRQGQSEQHAQLDKLIQATQYFLDAGEVKSAAKTFNVVIQLRRDNRLPDLRYRNIWALGAEIIMRQGEQERQRNYEGITMQTGDCEFRIPKRWGNTANIGKLKAYFEQLNQQHPYDHTAPQRTSAFDFNIAMVGCELYDAYIEYVSLLSTARREEGEDVTDEHGLGAARADENSLETQHLQDITDETLGRGRNIHLLTRAKVTDIAKYLDGLMRDPPYSRSHDYMRLRAIVALFLRDIATPLHGSTSNEDSVILRQETIIAKEMLQRIVDENGKLDDNFKTFLIREDDNSTVSDQLHSTLPIREL